ncbi:MAG TPA: bifunctional metallophosphatase/5'-nucleotidase [Fibrobacteria bacterium]|nr:bifunctional metallophosphatase/5'-nucleotidase [Fibrobacteria bacterium]
MRSRFHSLAFNALCLAASLSIAPRVAAQGCDSHHDDESAEMRDMAGKKIRWRHRDRMPDRIENVRLLAINDFHGNLSAGRLVSGRPVGSAPVLAAYLEQAADGAEDAAFIVHAGDHVGASPPVSALLQDEPSISFLNLMANRSCSEWFRGNPFCNIVGTLGNHEFDEGKGELLRLLYGGDHPKGPFLEKHWRGAVYPVVSANVVKTGTDKTLLPPFSIKFAHGMPIAFIGAVLKQTPTIVTPTGVEGLSFLDEAAAINKQAAFLRKLGVRAMVVLIHQGGFQPAYTGPTDSASAPLTGEIRGIVQNLSDDIDAVVSGHTHAFSNAIVKNRNGKAMLVTQSFSAGTAFGQIDLELDRKTRDVVGMSGQIITTWADQGPGLVPDPKVRAMVDKAEAVVAPLVNRVIGTADAAITAAQNAAGESALGNLIADAQRASVNADFGFMNPGGIRADLNAGTIAWGALFTIQPFANDVVKMTLTGAQIYTLLNQQWAGQASPRMLQVSGLTYTWDDSLPVGSKVTEVRRAGTPIGLSDLFTIHYAVEGRVVRLN